ncbi:aromatic amino acid lyase, partial [Candidatus Peregrinibacteria bacterium]|nr:aromatic amino acid lyase [Candidatus Peregrinibacteria bacterium]
PLALVMDFAKIALSELGNISERRTEKLLNTTHSKLPLFLVENSGLNSGMMIIQYTAAALVSENKVLAHPASVDSIPTSAEKEDHVSMGTIAARQAREILENVEHIIAIELLCGAQGIDLRTPLNPGKGTKIAYHVIRSEIPKLKNDRTLAPDIAKVVKLIKDRKIVKEVEKGIGKLEV